MKKPFLILIIFAFLVSEIILRWNQLAGFLVYSVLIGIILVALEKEEHLQHLISHSEKLLIFVLIVPIARIVEIFITFGLFWRILAFYSILAFLIIFYTRKFKINPGYTKKYLWFVPISIIIGILLGYLGNYVFNFEKNLILLTIIPLISLSEELLFRGMIQNYAKKDFGALFSMLSTSILFGIFSLGLGIMFALFSFACSLIICMIYDHTENIWLTIPINLAINVLLFVVSV